MSTSPPAVGRSRRSVSIDRPSLREFGGAVPLAAVPAAVIAFRFFSLPREESPSLVPLELSLRFDRASLRAWLVESGSIEEARETADRFGEKARKELEEIPASSAKTVLNEIASYVVNRKS